MIFQALGAKYTFGQAFEHLFAGGRADDSEKLRQLLSERYGGEAVLYRKGRAALAEAVRLATGGSGKVAISGLTCYSVVQAVETAGCKPVYVDIREHDLHFGADELSVALKNHPDIKAVIVQNMLGLSADITAIEELIKPTGAVLIEDLAHSAGAAYADGRQVGTVGDITMLSFGRDKAIDSVNGGALVVRRKFDQAPAKPDARPASLDELRDRLYPLIAWLSRTLYPINLGHRVMGVAIKLKLVVRSADGPVDTAEQLPDWQAKLAFRQIRRLTTTSVRRREKAKRYLVQLADYAPMGTAQSGSSPIRVPLLVSNRDVVVAHLRASGVQVNDIWYDVPVSPVRFYDKVNYPEADCPVAVRVAARLLNLPTHDRIKTSDIERIAALVSEVAQP